MRSQFSILKKFSGSIISSIIIICLIMIPSFADAQQVILEKGYSKKDYQAATQSVQTYKDYSAEEKILKKQSLLQDEIDEKCGFTHVEEMLKHKHQDRHTTEQFEQWMQEKIEKGEYTTRGPMAVITIPVVVHVIHNGEAVGTGSNISDAQVQSQIDVLNEDFRRLNADAANTPADFLGVAADAEIEFCLATVDPDGNPTSGINRYDGGQSSYSIANMETNIKPATIWHPYFYFNIWCAPLQGGLLGYAQFPSSSGLPGFDDDEGPAQTDGIVVRDWSFGTTGTATAPFNLGRTATHEAGHFFGLRHIWGDGGCGVDDFVSDTPTAGANNETGSPCTYPGPNSCDDGPGDLPDMFMNYMDYSDDVCMNIFTAGQKTRFDVVLSNSPRRMELLTSQVCNGTPPDYPFDPFADAPDNDLCENAIPVECNNPIDGTTNAASPIGDPVGEFCGTTVNGAGVWYTVEGTGQPITVSTCNNASFDTKINVFTGLCGSLTCVAGNDDGAGCAGFTSEVTFNSTNGETYLVFISGFGGATGDFTLTVTCDGFVGTPENDLCENAVPIACDESIDGTTVDATVDVVDFCGTAITSPGVWYSFVATSEFTNLSTCNQADFDTKISVFSGSCDDLECVGGQDDNVGAGCGGFTTHLDVPTTPGETYYVLVHGFGGASGDFTLTMTCLDAPENDLCENAIPVQCEDVVSGNTEYASATGAPDTDCSDDPFSDDLGAGVWYTLIGTGDEITLSTCENANFDTKIDVFTGSCDDLTCFAGNDDGPGCTGFTSELTFTSVEGETYYIYVSGFSAGGFTSVGDFTLTIDCHCVVDAGPCATVYYGYEPAECTDLTATADFGVPPYSYVWSTGETTQTITVCPMTETTYTVTVTDAEGCTNSDDVTVEVVDVRCGKKLNKVEVCHIPPGNPNNAHTICISPNAVETHLSHGDYLGACGIEPCDGLYPDNTGGSNNKQIAKGVENHDEDWNIYPNPAKGSASINLIAFYEHEVDITIFDATGNAMWRYPSQTLESAVVEVDLENMAQGVYHVVVRTDDQSMVKKLVITQ